MTPFEINDRKSLQMWLKLQPDEAAIVIAHRCALRAIGLIFVSTLTRPNEEKEFQTLGALRCTLASGLASVKKGAENQVLASLARDFLETSKAGSLRLKTMLRCVRAAAEAASALANDVRIHSACQAAESLNVLADRSLNVWDAISQDTARLSGNLVLSEIALWAPSRPNWYIDAIEKVRDLSNGNPNITWSFWLRWWQAAIAGRHIDWNLQRAVALIPNDIWQRGPNQVAEAIAKIEEQHNDQARSKPPAKKKASPRRAQTAKQIALTKSAMEQNRPMLPPTFDAIEGLILLEIERLQQRNYQDDFDKAECQRQISIFLTLHEAICDLRQQLPEATPITDTQAEKSISLVRLYASKFATLPRDKAQEVVDGAWLALRGTCQVGLIGATTALGVAYGLPAIAGVAIGAMAFAPKNAENLIKAAREGIGALPKP
jgi:hypothetical protein